MYVMCSPTCKRRPGVVEDKSKLRAARESHKDAIKGTDIVKFRVGDEVIRLGA